MIQIYNRDHSRFICTFSLTRYSSITRVDNDLSHIYDSVNQKICSSLNERQNLLGGEVVDGTEVFANV